MTIAELERRHQIEQSALITKHNQSERAIVYLMEFNVLATSEPLERALGLG